MLESQVDIVTTVSLGLEQGNHTEDVKQSVPQSEGSQYKEKHGNSRDVIVPPLFSKPSVQDAVKPVSEPMFSRSSSQSPQEVEKEKEAAALAWAAAEEQPTHPETESIGKGNPSVAIFTFASLLMVCARQESCV